MKRQWILTDTGIVRRPVKGEFYLNIQNGRPMQATTDDHECLRIILRMVFVEEPEALEPQCCNECNDTNPICGDIRPYGAHLICTRALKHKGLHVACGSGDRHDLAIWPQKSAPGFDEWNW